MLMEVLRRSSSMARPAAEMIHTLLDPGESTQLHPVHIRPARGRAAALSPRRAPRRRPSSAFARPPGRHRANSLWGAQYGLCATFGFSDDNLSLSVYVVYLEARSGHGGEMEEVVNTGNEPCEAIQSTYYHSKLESSKARLPDRDWCAGPLT